MPDDGRRIAGMDTDLVLVARVAGTGNRPGAVPGVIGLAARQLVPAAQRAQPVAAESESYLSARGRPGHHRPCRLGVLDVTRDGGQSGALRVPATVCRGMV